MIEIKLHKCSCCGIIKESTQIRLQRTTINTWDKPSDQYARYSYEYDACEYCRRKIDEAAKAVFDSLQGVRKNAGLVLKLEAMNNG